jgi:hypothetical protein
MERQTQVDSRCIQRVHHRVQVHASVLRETVVQRKPM